METLLYLTTGSVGLYLLGIRRATITCTDTTGKPVRGGTLLVDPDIYRNESWLTLRVGTGFILEGSKQLVRWTMGMPAIPMFGFAMSGTPLVIGSLLLGGLEVHTGYTFLRLKRFGAWIGIAIAATIILSVALSWSLWDAFVRELVMNRRSVQGLTVREGEIAFMQAVMPGGIVIMALLGIIAMASSRRRLLF